MKRAEIISDKKDDVRIAIDSLIGEYEDFISSLKDKIESVSDWEDKWVVFQHNPADLTSEEIGEMFNHYERRAHELSAYMQGEEICK